MLLLAAALPALLWEGDPKTASDLRDAGITHIAVAEKQAAEWKSAAGITVEAVDLKDAVKLITPSVDYQMNVASATRAPWVKSNGARILRAPRARFVYDAPGAASALAAAEAFAFGASAWIHTDAAGLKPLGAMMALLRTIPDADLQPVADIGFVDDGSFAAGEAMNLMIRNNLLFRIVPAPDPRLKINVRLTPEDAKKNPALVAHQARADLTDDRRSVRIYGSQVAIVRLSAADGHLRVHLLNYDAARRQVDGIRVRVTGRFERSQVAAPQMQLQDFTVEDDATEFTLPVLKNYAVVDLFRK